MLGRIHVPDLRGNNAMSEDDIFDIRNKSEHYRPTSETEVIKNFLKSLYSKQ